MTDSLYNQLVLCCGTNLDEDEYGQMLMMAVGESIDLTCPKCGTVWRFWIEVVTRQKKIGQKKIKKLKN